MAEPARPWFHRGETPAGRREDIARIGKAIEEAAARSGRRAPVPRTAEQRMRDLISERSTRLASTLYRAEHARREVERLEEQARTLESEIAGYETGLRALLGEVLERADQWATPHWSPVPVLGYRMWSRREGRLRGARTVWDAPQLEARCLGRARPERSDVGVPHSNGECGRPPCGIYALRSADRMLAQLTLPDRVVGLVALSGKVVEHDRGFRAQIARVVALGITVDRTVFLSADRQWIAGVFAGADPRSMPGDARGIPISPRPDPVIREFFEQATGRYAEPWTSESRSE